MIDATYEVQVREGGTWRIESFFDDRELASREARRKRENAGGAEVRVVETRWDAKAQSFKSRILFCATKPRPRTPFPENGRAGPEPEPPAQPRQTRTTASPAEPAPSPRDAPRPHNGASTSPSFDMLALTAAALSAFGALAIYLLRQYGA